jgi:hypothetical protein
MIMAMRIASGRGKCLSLVRSGSLILLLPGIDMWMLLGHEERLPLYFTPSMLSIYYIQGQRRTQCHTALCAARHDYPFTLALLP